ncbi:PREDICTED: E3 ubiquitin-protein ligase RNF115, partial [Buceros rhinoceros silvestris]|uniref:E3 ubiquitin-protein ligase RNF115 n=1 Tax=Buceros rhinoceros silvestris TaxID=175836 RepID=UPI000528815F
MSPHVLNLFNPCARGKPEGARRTQSPPVSDDVQLQLIRARRAPARVPARPRPSLPFLCSFLDGSGADDSPSTQFAELWDHLDHTMFFPDFRPFLSSSSLDQDSRDNERGHQAHADLWGPSRPPRLPMTRRIIQQIFAGFFANSAIPGSQHPFSCPFSSPQLLGQLENTGPPPADKEKISSLPTVTVTQEQVGRSQCPVPPVVLLVLVPLKPGSARRSSSPLSCSGRAGVFLSDGSGGVMEKQRVLAAGPGVSRYRYGFAIRRFRG